MTSRRDQLQSYQFLLQRVISAVVTRETDPAQAPLRRGVGAAFVGVMVAIILAAGFGIHGLLSKVGGDQWRSDGAVLVERETGAAFVYGQGTLTPVVNYTSALLLSGKAPPQVFTVARAALDGVPRGTVRGIPNAPAALPAAGGVTHPPWALCSATVQDEAGRPVARTGLLVGRGAPGGRDLADAALLVRDPATGSVHLVWHGHRHRVVSPQTVVASVFGARAAATLIGTAWIDGLPEGEQLGPLPVPGRGQASPAVPGRRIGDLLVTAVGVGRQYYLVLADGLAPVTAVQEAVLAGQYPITPREVPEAAANRLPASRALDATGNRAPPLPADPPELADPSAAGTAVCAEYTDPRSAPRLVVAADPGPALQGVRTPGRTSTGTVLADAVSVPAGRVAVVRTVTSPNDPGGAYCLVTDTGLRYPVADAGVLPMLGFAPRDATGLPAGLVNRVPAGPALSPDAAARAVPP